MAVETEQDAYEDQLNPRDWLDPYQKETKRTGRAYDGTKEQLSILGLGLTGEAGEVADVIKKYVGHGVAINPDDMRSELGDVMWYLAELCRYFGWTLKEVQDANVAKLRARYPDGFVQGGGNR